MQLHGNAALSLKKRRLLCRRVVEEGWALTQAAEAAEVSARTAGKWVRRYRAEGELGLLDRPSTPLRSPNRTPEPTIETIAALRRVRFTGPQIAELGMACSTVSGVLKRIGLGKLSRLEPPEPPNRYERRHPGDLIHIDIKTLGRIERGPGHRLGGRRRGNPTVTDAAGRRRRQVGWECVHVAVDDHSRLAFAAIHPDERATTVVAFLRQALAFYRDHGIEVREVMSDNGPGYRSIAFKVACRTLGIRHIRTRPYRPRTNGKAERFIRTMLTEWAYGIVYGDSTQRAAALPRWLERYNTTRPHGSLGHKPPITRLRGNNLLGTYT